MVFHDSLTWTFEEYLGFIVCLVSCPISPPIAKRQFLFHVLRTYRHAAGEKRKAEVNAKARALHL